MARKSKTSKKSFFEDNRNEEAKLLKAQRQEEEEEANLRASAHQVNIKLERMEEQENTKQDSMTLVELPEVVECQNEVQQQKKGKQKADVETQEARAEPKAECKEQEEAKQDPIRLVEAPAGVERKIKPFNFKDIWYHRTGSGRFALENQNSSSLGADGYRNKRKYFIK